MFVDVDYSAVVPLYFLNEGLKLDRKLVISRELCDQGFAFRKLMHLFYDVPQPVLLVYDLLLICVLKERSCEDFVPQVILTIAHNL